MNLLKVGLQSIKLELSSIDDYIEETAVNLASKQKDLENKYEKARSNGSEDEDLAAYFNDDFHRYHKLFPSFSFNSILVSQFSFFETRLKFLCELYHRKGFSNVRLADLYGSDIEKCKRYLTLVAGLDFRDFQDKWKRILDIQKLRNSIVHNSANVVRGKDEYIISFIKADQQIDYNEHHGDFYIKEASFLREFSELILGFFTLLVDKLSETRVIARNTSMPYNNSIWGREKAHTLLEEVINGIQLIRDNEVREDEFKDSDLKGNIESTLKSMAWNLTKLYAFFYDGEWSATHRDLIIGKGESGLIELERIYKRE